MSRYIIDVRQSVRFAVSDLSADVTEIPGFCLPKKVSQFCITISVLSSFASIYRTVKSL